MWEYMQGRFFNTLSNHIRGSISIVIPVLLCVEYGIKQKSLILLCP